MAKFSITIDDNVAAEIDKEAKEGESTSNVIERLVVTAIGRLGATRRYAKAHAKKAKPAKKAKAAKAKPAKKARKPKAEAQVTHSEAPADIL